MIANMERHELLFIGMKRDMADKSLAGHILPSSATMVGVCLTTISLVKLLEDKTGASHIDEYLALDSILFLISAGLSYFALRPNAKPALAAKSEQIADRLFIIGLCAMVIVATIFAFEL